ncbi:extracellular matrix regulator RemB [Salirhabdus salicampi]|uniref:extracellular matrix regulator RemB n=1 Tax=Salirhabdus salicampi TaxID=476102 RepID=UPI0020C395D1|nr:DUF370 domain-containing protein [Salirhabdus salicampi]MCP8617199.1 DUF370 domain-containing protein [Salirhabdus salicampi]
MFIHIGEDHVIRSDDVVAIIDHALFSSSTIVEEMIMNLKKEKKVVESLYESAKSIVITDDFVYFSSLAVSTLRKRSQLAITLDKLEDYSDNYDEE